MKYTKEDIEKLIANVELELKGFDRATADNSKKMLEALKQTLKLFAVPVVSEQRELLIAFSDWMFIQHYHEPPSREIIDEYIGSL